MKLLGFLLLTAMLTGCLSGDTDGAPPGLGGLRTDDPADRIGKPTIPDKPEPFSLPAPDLERLVGLLPDVPRPRCPDAVLADTGASFQPTAPAPHAVAYDDGLGCALVTGATAEAHGTSIQLSQDNGPTLGEPGARMGGTVAFTVDGAQQSLSGARILSWTATGAFRIQTAEPHAVTLDALDLPLAGARFEDRVSDRDGPSGLATLQAEDDLEGTATVVLGDGSQATGTLAVAAGPHELGGIGRLRIEYDKYEAEGDVVRVDLHDVQGLDIAGNAFSGRVGLDARHATLASTGGAVDLDAAVDQAWRSGSPLLRGALAVETGPGRITIREASGAASLEAVRVVIDDPASTGDPLFENGTIEDLATRMFQAFVGAYTFGVHDPLHFETVRLPAGGSVTIAIDADAGSVTARVTTANGGTWEGAIPT